MVPSSSFLSMLLLTPLFIIQGALYFEFNNDYTKTFENSLLLFSKVIQIQLFLNFVSFFYKLFTITNGFKIDYIPNQYKPSCLFDNLFFVHSVLSVIIFSEMSRFCKYKFVQIISIIFVIPNLLYVLQLLCLKMTGRKILGKILRKILEKVIAPQYIYFLVLSFFISQITLFIQNVISLFGINMLIK